MLYDTDWTCAVTKGDEEREEREEQCAGGRQAPNGMLGFFTSLLKIQRGSY